jgi:hypothetical protein
VGQTLTKLKSKIVCFTNCSIQDLLQVKHQSQCKKCAKQFVTNANIEKHNARRHGQWTQLCRKLVANTQYDRTFFPRPACKARGRGQGATIHGEHGEKPPLKIGEVAETKIRPGFR